MSRAGGWYWLGPGEAAGGFMYDGTSDVPFDWLADTTAEAWDRYAGGEDWHHSDHPKDCTERIPAQFYTDYGDGSWWTGHLCLTHQRILGPFDAFEAVYDGTERGGDGRPPWALVSPS